MTAGKPGLGGDRLLRLMRRSVAETRLDLSGRVVLTEAATGPYAVTPVLAALAGAEVVALTRPTRYGSVEEVTAQVMALAEAAGVAGRITVTTERRPEDIARADVVTNSGHVRPIDEAMVALMKPTAVVPLMFEAWEAEAGRSDLDIPALRKHGVEVAGTNERHPDVDVFSYLGLMAVKQLLDAGIPAYRSRIAVLCDNPFSDFIVRGLTGAGAEVTAGDSLDELLTADQPEALLVAVRPTGASVLTADELDALAARWPDTLVAQYWGDLDRDGLAARGVRVWPENAPGAGHMGVLPSAVGPDPIVRLQAGGLKVAEVLLRPAADRTEEDREFVDELV
ncbi:hypothetical protein ACTI_47230 [Actinoplanes sp. OR16]|uniref:hypothetical protein n=1 Tax=Actinoplanes sp. OR16 TaxID=946334 RepID=UPI000F6E6E7B|nr:hypothetical protein [Actinoplanes sp. OR16]BBH68038.1 hypothetical protein ACTI_47230 [Actinoplanes sp. OR16]